MPEIKLNGQVVRFQPGTTVAAAILNSGITQFRKSIVGEDRAPICGMGVCYECRVTINGQPQQRSCMFLCADGMEVETGA